MKLKLLQRLLPLVVLLTPPLAQAQPAGVARVSALADGKLLLNGKPADLRAIEREFQRIKKIHGAVWYYREKAESEPPAAAMAVIKLVVQYGLPVSMSSKPDFSDYIDADGRPQPKTP